MKIDVKFPTAEEKFEAEICEHRSNSADERIMAMAELTCLCESFLSASPRREQQIHILEENERFQNDCWRKLIHRYVRGEGSSVGTP